MSIRVEKRSEHIRPHKDAIVTFKECGNISEISHSTNAGIGSPVRKIDKNTYVDIRDGSVHEFKHNNTRYDDTISVSRTLKELRDLINTNCVDVSKCLFITLTYRENMTDTEKLYNDFKNFRKRFKPIFGATEYILVVEPQARGAWHGHLILVFPTVAPFIANQTLADMWKQGFVKISKLDNVDNVGAYLTAYLTDIPLDEAGRYDINPDAFSIKDCESIGEDGKTVSKRLLKGARLHMYPAGMRIYRHSKGIKKPEVLKCRETEARTRVEGILLTHESTRIIRNDETGFASVVNRRYYNKARKDCI